MYDAVLVTPPAERPVSLEEAKAQLRVSHSDEDAYILALIDAAVSHLEGPSGILGRCLVNQTWALSFDAWATTLALPLEDARDVVLTYKDTAGGTQTVLSSFYVTGSFAAFYGVRFRPTFTYPSLHADFAPITATFTAGYGTAADVPAAIKQGIKLHVQALYDGQPYDQWWPAYAAMIGAKRVPQV